MTDREMYDRTIHSLSPGERLQLATLILNDMPPQSVIDDRDE